MHMVILYLKHIQLISYITEILLYMFLTCFVDFVAAKGTSCI